MCKRKIVRNVIIAIVALIVTVGFSTPSSFAAAKSSGKAKGYVPIYEKPVKVGNYYYKTKWHYPRESKDGIARSKKRSSGYKTVIRYGDNYSIFSIYTNGKVIYYLYEKNEKCWLYRCSSSGKTKQRLKRIPFRNGYIYNIETIYKGNIYISTGFPGGDVTTYRYNIRSKKLSKEANKLRILQRSGRYVITTDFLQSDIGSGKKGLYKITSSGKLRKVRDLTRGYGDAAFVGKHIYCVDFVNKWDDEWNPVYPITMEVYRYKTNGSKAKKLASKSYNKGRFLAAYKITAKHCLLVYYDDKGQADYLFNYKTEKVTKKR